MMVATVGYLYFFSFRSDVSVTCYYSRVMVSFEGCDWGKPRTASPQPLGRARAIFRVKEYLPTRWDTQEYLPTRWDTQEDPPARWDTQKYLPTRWDTQQYQVYVAVAVLKRETEQTEEVKHAKDSNKRTQWHYTDKSTNSVFCCWVLFLHPRYYALQRNFGRKKLKGNYSIFFLKGWFRNVLFHFIWIRLWAQDTPTLSALFWSERFSISTNTSDSHSLDNTPCKIQDF